MKKICQLLTALLCICSLLSLAACGDETKPETYKVTYVSESGTGTAPEEKSYAEGTTIIIAENPFENEGYRFTGWKNGSSVYQAGDSYTVPNRDTTFVAQWEKDATAPTDPDNPTNPTDPTNPTEPTDPDKPEPQPAFSKESYSYDRLGGGTLTLPLDLDGAGLFYVKVNGEMLPKTHYTYDTATKALVISEDYVLTLDLGTVTITAITDASAGEIGCTVTVEQSLITSFDSQTSKAFAFGKDGGVTFEVGYNGTTPKKLLRGNVEVDASYYTYDDHSFTIKAEYLSIWPGTSEYCLILSNNDLYKFTVASNILFATDYDNITEHDTTKSNLGHNPLYQYYDAVSIVEGPVGMSGKVLKITPNTEPVTYDCNGYITLRANWWDGCLWREVSFTKGKYYVISFDYMTEGTSTGEFCVKAPNGASWSDDLLLGAENDGIVHHYQNVVSMDDLQYGVFIRAYFENAGGNVYIDNFKIAQLDTAPSITDSETGYLAGSGKDLVIPFDAADLTYTVKMNGQKISAVYNDVQKTLTIPADVMAQFGAGKYTLEIETPAVVLKVTVRITDNSTAEIVTGRGEYYATKRNSVKIYGSFDPNLTLVSLKQLDKAYDDGYSGGWDFAHADVNKDYASLVTFHPALDGKGYIEIPAALCDLFWGETAFVAEFSNMATGTFVLDSVEVPFFTNYDDTTIRGQFNGGFKDSPLESGMWNGPAIGVEERENGNYAWFVRSTKGGSDRCAFTIRMHSHPWEWYTVQGKEGNFYRVTFDYQISDVSGDVYFYIMTPPTENWDEKFLGDYDQLDYVGNDDYYKVRYNLIADGQTHTFDSGWFAYNPSLTMMKIQLPEFEAADGRFVMIDNYRIVTSDKISYRETSLGDYEKGMTGDYGFGIGSETVASATVDGETLGYTVANGKVLFDKTQLDGLEPGKHCIIVVTEEGGVYKTAIGVGDGRVSVLSETNKHVTFRGGAVKLSGEFDETLTVVSVTRYGADTVWDNGGGAVAMNTKYVTVRPDGLILSEELVDQMYKTGRYVVTLSNGKSVEFTLESNTTYYSNYDETNLYLNLGGNSVACQDSSMREFVSIDGNNMMKYTPGNATLWHSTQAINGHGSDNFFITFENRLISSLNWYDLYYDVNDTLFVSFAYKIVPGENQPSHYQVVWIDMSGEHHVTELDGEGTFYMEISLTECKAFGVNCPAMTPAEVAGSYMLMDNLAVGVLDEETEYVIGVAEVETKRAEYYATKGESVKIYGSFDPTLTIASLRQRDKVYNDGYIGGWDFAHADVSKNYASFVTFHPELDGKGYIEIPASMCDLFWGETEFLVEFSNGETGSFVIDSVEVPFFTNYDDTTIRGELNGGFKDSPLESGMWNGARIGVEDRGNGNYAWFVRSTRGAADMCAFTIRMHSHPWEWYTVQGTEGNFYRVTFEYQISDVSGDVYFYIMTLAKDNWDAYFFGDYDQLDYVPGDDYYKVRFNLIADGQPHTFDSGWFAYDPTLTMMKIQLPDFEAADGRFVMVDNYRIVTSNEISYLPASLGEYKKGMAGDYGFEVGGQTVTSITLGGKELSYTVTDGMLLLDKKQLDEFESGNHVLVVVTADGTAYKKTISISDDRISVLSETHKLVSFQGGAVKLNGQFDESLTVISVTRYGADTVWDNGGNAVAMNTKYVTVCADGLVLSEELVKQMYKTGRYVVTLSNGKSVEFTLESNTTYYSNYDETNLYLNLGGNSVACQDSSMRDLVSVDGNHMMKYTPGNATLWHSIQAINGNGADNFIFTFENRTTNFFNWYDLYYDIHDTLFVSFGYKIVTEEGKPSHYRFTWIDMNNQHHVTELSGEGTFYMEIPLTEGKAFGVNCPAMTPADVAGSYMLVDNLAVGILGTTDTTYLTEKTKDVTYGGGDVLLAGSFEDSLTVTSLTRSGDNYWDDTSFHASKQAAQLSTSYVTLSENGLTVKSELIDMLYGTQTFYMTLSNGDVVRFVLKSNVLFYTNYDEVKIHELSQGNVASCQDTGMWQILGEEGNQYIRYTPGNATQWHSVQAMNGNGGDNFIFTFSNPTLGNHWWWEYALPTEGKLFVRFDYNITLGDGLDSHFVFCWFDAAGTAHETALSGSGTFEIEIDANNVAAMGIRCPVASPDLISGSYMDIDNYGFGIVK